MSDPKVQTSINYFFFVFCVSALAATALACLLAVLLRRIFDAAEATRLPVVSLALLVCVSADAATAFSALLAVLLLKTFDAAEDTFLPVDSDFAMVVASSLNWPRSGAVRRGWTMADSQ